MTGIEPVSEPMGFTAELIPLLRSNDSNGATLMALRCAQVSHNLSRLVGIDGVYGESYL